jgi:hypothetical protein
MHAHRHDADADALSSAGGIDIIEARGNGRGETKDKRGVKWSLRESRSSVERVGGWVAGLSGVSAFIVRLYCHRPFSCFLILYEFLRVYPTPADSETGTLPLYGISAGCFNFFLAAVTVAGVTPKAQCFSTVTALSSSL